MLGESHHCTEETVGSDFTREVILSHLERAIRHLFFTKIGRLLLQMANSKESEIWIFDQILFLDYIQTCVEKARTKPIKSMWDAARDPFLWVLRVHRPDVLLVLGKQLWGTMTAEGA